MQKFLKRTAIFILSATGLIVVVLFAARLTTIHSGSYALPPDKKFLILGHSHPECAYNDSLLPGFVNMAQSGESYFYTYFKTKALVANSPDLRAVFIEFTNNYETVAIDEWIWGDQYVAQKYPKYFAFMSAADVILILRHNAQALMNAQSLALKKSAAMLLPSTKPNWKRNNWGGFFELDAQKADSLAKIATKMQHTNQPILQGKAKPNHNLLYLEKIVRYCRANQLKVYFVRSPLHPAYSGKGNEKRIQEWVKHFAPDKWLDFSQLRFGSDEWGDLEHLNGKGAERFSKVFISLIDAGLLSASNPQQMIDSTNHQLQIEHL